MIVDKVKDHEGLVKDRQSGAILMASHSQAAEYLNKKKQIQQQHEIRNEINTIKERLEGLENIQSDVSEIKNLLQKLAK
jgi:hypothetical protein